MKISARSLILSSFCVVVFYLASWLPGSSVAVAALAEAIFSSSFEILVLNQPPIADAGTDQIVYGGGNNPVFVTAERSADADGVITAFSWEVLSGPGLAFDQPAGKTTGFLPPVVAVPTEIILQVTVTDNGGLTDSAQVTVTVVPAAVTITASSLDGGVTPIILLLDKDGNQLGTTTGNPAILVWNLLPAGVYYAAVTSDTPGPTSPIVLEVTGPGGLLQYSEVTNISLSPADFASNALAYFPEAKEGSVFPGPPPFEFGIPQLVEFAVDHPQYGLRDPDQFLEFLNRTSVRDDEDNTTAEAYYRTIDPLDERLTLQDWLDINGFTANGADAHATYQNNADLGFGRDMYARQTGGGGVAAYVRNFPSLDHALVNEKLIATVTMEWVEPPGGGDRFITFYAYGPNGERLLAADLDGRGAKSIPGVCNVCHGGRPKAVVQDGSGNAIYPDHGDTDAQFLPWDVDTFIFSAQPGLTRAAQEAELYALNQIVLDTFPASAGAATAGKWNGVAAREVVEGWYQGGPVFDGSFIPPGWAGVSAEQDALYSEVIAPNCRACHVTRGTTLQNAIDFGSYDKFIGFAPQIRELVYNRGVMPLALRTFGHFWNETVSWDGNTVSPARVLAEFLDSELPAPPLVQATDETLKPGRPDARMTYFPDGPTRFHPVDIDRPGGALLDVRDSLFAPEVEWLTSNGGAVQAITPQGTRHARLDFPAGPFQFETRVIRQIVPPASVRRSSITPQDLAINRFVFDILDLIDPTCTGCHSAGGVPGIPVLFDGDDSYYQVIDRLDFVNPMQSLLLTKAAGWRHGRNNATDVAGAAVPGWELFDADWNLLNARGAAAAQVLAWMQQGTHYTPDLGTQSCRNVGRAIPDNDPAGLVERMEIGLSDSIERLVVYLRLDHTFIPQLEITLTHLDTGASSTLIQAVPGVLSCERDNMDVFFSDTGNTQYFPFCQVNPPFPDPVLTQAPVTPLSAFNGELLNGTWQLTVSDNEALDEGVLHEWCLRNGKLP